MDNFGWRWALKQAVRSLRDPTSLAPPQPLADRPMHPFDALRGIDTGGYVPGEDLQTEVSGGSRFFATAFQSIAPSSLVGALELLPEGPAGWTFVDIGCGKGRALIVAAEFGREGAGFDRIVGVELSPALAKEASRNVAGAPDAHRIEIEVGDATGFRFPDSPLVVFLYHPFLPPVLKRLLASLKRQVDSNPRPVYLLYANLSYHRVMARLPWLVQVWDSLVRLSDEDVAANNFDITHERYTLYQVARPEP